MKVLGLYFSGTGNTAYAVRRLCQELGSQCVYSIENFAHFSECADCDTIVVGYPIYGSDMPQIMRDFLAQNAQWFADKKLITLVTQAVFSGDGGALAHRILRKQRTKCIASIHVTMPSNISDFTIFKLKNAQQIAQILTKANARLHQCATRILAGKGVRHGRRIFSWLLGFLGQRCYYRTLIAPRLRKALKLDSSICVRCGKCVASCPAHNITEEAGDMRTHDRCAQCYRCVNLCPVCAISLMSKRKPITQYGGVADADFPIDN